MDKKQFVAMLRSDGFTEIETKELGPRPANEGHGHSYAVRGLVLAGAFTYIPYIGPAIVVGTLSVVGLLVYPTLGQAVAGALAVRRWW